MTDHAPAAGDLLITRSSADGPFEISIVPGRPQFAVAQQHEAIRQAHAFARKSGAAVWIVDRDGTIRRVQPPPPRKES